MCIGIVVDLVCDLLLDFIQQYNIVLLFIIVCIGEVVLVDYCDEQVILSFLYVYVVENGVEVEIILFSVNQICDLFLGKLVIDYDYVFCMMIIKMCSLIYDNVMQVSFVIFNDYKLVCQVVGYNLLFVLCVLDIQNLFVVQGVIVVEVVCLCDSGVGVQQICEWFELLVYNVYGYMVICDLYYMCVCVCYKGDCSVGLLSVVLGSVLDIKLVLYGYCGEIGLVVKIKGFDNVVQKLFDFVG